MATKFSKPIRCNLVSRNFVPREVFEEYFCYVGCENLEARFFQFNEKWYDLLDMDSTGRYDQLCDWTRCDVDTYVCGHVIIGIVARYVGHGTVEVATVESE